MWNQDGEYVPTSGDLLTDIINRERTGATQRRLSKDVRASPLSVKNTLRPGKHMKRAARQRVLLRTFELFCFRQRFPRANGIKRTIVLPSETEPALHNSSIILILHSFMPCSFFFSPWSYTTLARETFFELASSLAVRLVGSKNNDCWQHFKRSVPSTLL